MAAPVTTTTSDARRVPDADTAASAALLVSSASLVLAGTLTVLSLLAVVVPASFEGLLSAGRLRPAATVATVLGWLVVALTGAVYYVLPRLTGAPLWREDLARAGIWAMSVLAVAGTAVTIFGLGDGLGPLSLPWWLDLPVFLVLCIPALVTVRTVAARAERGVFVSLWFVMAAVAWLPLLYLMTNLPNLSAMGRGLQAVTFDAGFASLWVTAVGVGVAYYTVVKTTDGALANRQLARVGFWSLAFAATWAGPVQVAFGPTPDWLDAVSAVMTLALPIAALANAGAITATIGDRWKEIGSSPTLLATAAGIGFTLLVGFATAAAAFRSAAALVGLTPYWDGIAYLSLFGVGGLLVAGWAYQAITPMTGRAIVSDTQAVRAVRLIAWGAGLTGMLMLASGILRGYAWTAVAFTDPSSAWGTAAGTSGVLFGVTVLTGAVALAGQIQFALVIARTVTSGRVADQEVLVAREPGDE